MSLACTVVMPAYNEKGCIAAIVAEWTAELTQLFGAQWSLLVINDGSRDGTGAILDALAKDNLRLTVYHQANQGHGATVMNGYKMAVETDTDYVFQTDSDGQLEAKDFSALWQRRSESRFILGKRQNRQDPAHRLIISKLAQLLISFIFGLIVPDGNVPFRLMERNFLRTLLPLIPAGMFAPNLCLSIAAKRQGERLLSIPVHHKARETGTVSIVRWSLIRACWRSLSQLVRWRLSPAWRG